jgi:hypothetical protein
MSETQTEIEMARRGFGYGRWDAPYWFIGLEEGKGPGESPGNSKRIDAWYRLEKDGLSDCQLFHNAIGEGNWHRVQPNLSPTWRPLILLLKAFLNESTNNDDLREYQRAHWGCSTGETCLIELSGTAARSLKEKIDRERFRDERIRFIRGKLAQSSPTFVVMYGVTRRADWVRLVGLSLEIDRIVRRDQTLFVMTPSPTAFGRKNADWISLGRRLREEARTETQR